MVADPVCGMKVDEKRSEYETQFAGTKYSFCSENCKREFEAIRMSLWRRLRRNW